MISKNTFFWTAERALKTDHKLFQVQIDYRPLLEALSQPPRGRDEPPLHCTDLIQANIRGGLLIYDTTLSSHNRWYLYVTCRICHIFFPFLAGTPIIPTDIYRGSQHTLQRYTGIVLSRDRMTTDGVWIGNRIYWPPTTRNYKQRLCSHCSTHFTDHYRTQ
jgi:hypothetical protein